MKEIQALADKWRRWAKHGVNMTYEQQLTQLREHIRQITIERDDYKAVVVAREAGYAIERIDGGWWWWRRSEMGCAQYGPYPHMFAAARAAIGEVKGQAAVKAREHLAARDAIGEVKP